MATWRIYIFKSKVKVYTSLTNIMGNRSKYLKSRKIQYVSQSKYFFKSINKDHYCTKHLKVKITKKSSFTPLFC